METKYAKAKFLDVFKYSFGGLGSNLAFFLVMSYLTFFYTDIFGISSMVVSGLMLISRFIDAFTDPVMGMLGDHTRSKMENTGRGLSGELLSSDSSSSFFLQHRTYHQI